MGNLGCGISLEGGSFDNAMQGNLVSGNYGPGIAIGDALSSYNAILGNMVGTDATGTRAIPNDGTGIGVGWMGANFNRIGGTRPGEGNLVSGNKGGGISVGSQDNLVRGNTVGTDITGRTALGNDGGGVGLSEGRSIVGGMTPLEANIISGNGWFGVSVESDDNVIAGNFIGTDAADQATTGNVASGVSIRGRHTILQANIIANTMTTSQNGGGGGVSLGSQSNTTIRRNRIHGNAAGGIGGNPGVAAPVISSVGIGSVSGTACPGCEVEIFSDAEDEGRVFEGSVVADAAGSFAFQIDRFLAGPFVTATATDPSGITSAFSAPRAAPPRPPRRRAARH
jgi:titin